MSTVVLYCWCHSDSASVLLYFTFDMHLKSKSQKQREKLISYLSLFNVLNYFVWLRIADEGLVPEMRIWSILLIKSDLKWCIHLSRSLFFYISTTKKSLGECHCWWTKESPRTHVTKFYGQIRLIMIGSVLRASKFSVIKID